MAEPPRATAGRTPVWSVSDFIGQARRHIETAFGDLCIVGELSNFKRHTSGHCYFTLKDADAQVRCVMWQQQARAVYFQPQDGMFVQLYGRASVYEPRGDLQVVARALRLGGEGALQQAFNALKEKLAAEGLFDAGRKRPLPAFPRRVGIVTSGSGAALQDLLSILERRYPLLEVLVCPVQVQGIGAAETIVEAIAAFNSIPPDDPLRPDVLIVGRGGGSAEDLWAFNEEILARAIFSSDIPIVSAVGHETDFTIADYVADVRAATPSMAAEIVAPDQRELQAFLRGVEGRLADLLRQRIDEGRQRLRTLVNAYGFRQPVYLLDQHRQRIDELARRLQRTAPRAIALQQTRLASIHHRLTLLDPSRPLRQGYVVVEQEGRRLFSAGEVAPEGDLTLRFWDGKKAARVVDLDDET
ncbi:MAG: exodeoxyribonuclease VII large subunit [Rhodothermales bacterium]|nr:exodeoxyribonuclease VII large subunit [Rhodothermales bacterium]